MKRRHFLQIAISGGASSLFIPAEFKLIAAQNSYPDVVWVEGGEPDLLVQKAFGAYGGIQTFISKGDVVVVKPNIGWDRAPHFAANTNPMVVAEVVKLCYEAGAKTVKIFDRTCNNPQRCYRNSQIEKFALQVGADVSHIRERKFKNVALPGGDVLREWPIYEEYLDADKVINIPVAKHHSLSHVTLGLKNLMGVMGGERGEIHNKFETKLVDITAHILPALTVIDAYRILLRNGPVGGNLSDVKLTKTLIVSPCIVAADQVALGLFGYQVSEIGYLKTAISRQINKFNPANLNLMKINLG